MLCIPVYRRLHDGDLLLKHIGGFKFVDDLQFCAIYVHMFVHINDLPYRNMLPPATVQFQ